MCNIGIANMIFSTLSDGYDDEEHRPETVAELTAELDRLGDISALKSAIIALCERVEELES